MNPTFFGDHSQSNHQIRRSLLKCLIALTLILGSATTLRAEHAKITLEAEASGNKETAHMDQTPPATGKNPRPVLKAKAGEPIKIQYMFTNIYPHKTIENVVVHFYVVKQAKVGQKELPKLDDNSLVIQSAFDMDFKPGSKAGAKTTIKISEPGTYLIRVESRQTQSDHEHFSAIDLVVEK